MNLFLDDFRNPIDVFSYTHKQIYMSFNWDIVRSYPEFVNYIHSYYDNKGGLPELISFDHDLADEHYSGMNHGGYINYDGSKEKTGYSCALWLVNFCMDNNLKLPYFLCHSMNPEGKKNIMTLLTNFAKSQKQT